MLGFFSPRRLLYAARVSRSQSSHYINSQAGTSHDLSASPALQVLCVLRRKCRGQRRDCSMAASFTGNVHTQFSKNGKADLFCEWSRKQRVPVSSAGVLSLLFWSVLCLKAPVRICLLSPSHVILGSVKCEGSYSHPTI